MNEWPTDFYCGNVFRRRGGDDDGALVMPPSITEAFDDFLGPYVQVGKLIRQAGRQSVRQAIVAMFTLGSETLTLGPTALLLYRSQSAYRSLV